MSQKSIASFPDGRSTADDRLLKFLEEEIEKKVTDAITRQASARVEDYLRQRGMRESVPQKSNEIFPDGRYDRLLKVLEEEKKVTNEITRGLDMPPSSKGSPPEVLMRRQKEWQLAEAAQRASADESMRAITPVVQRCALLELKRPSREPRARLLKMHGDKHANGLEQCTVPPKLDLRRHLAFFGAFFNAASQPIIYAASNCGSRVFPLGLGLWVGAKVALVQNVKAYQTWGQWFNSYGLWCTQSAFSFVSSMVLGESELFLCQCLALPFSFMLANSLSFVLTVGFEVLMFPLPRFVRANHYVWQVHSTQHFCTT